MGEGTAEGRRVAVSAGRRRPHRARKQVVVAAGGRRPRRARRQPAAAPVQRLFQACRAIFRGPGTVPAPAEVALLRAILDSMRPEDVGLSSDMALSKPRDVAQRNPAITHTTIHKSDNFSMVILSLPQNAVIPLHNHPGMTVFSKLLLGSMHVKSYDWAGPDPAEGGATPPSDDRLRVAELVLDCIFTAPCDTSVLYPTAGGNMHRFRAIAPCVILDVIGPPYSTQEDRDCTYYADAPYTQHTSTELTGDKLEGRRLAWLKEIEMPRDLNMFPDYYDGPAVFER